MSIRLLTTHGGALLSPGEVQVLRERVTRVGRTTLLVPSFAARDAARRVLADEGLGLGIDVQTPQMWLQGLWGLLGDGRQMVTAFQRQMVMAAVLATADAKALEPLRDTPGTVRMLSSMAADLLPVARAAVHDAVVSDAEARVLELLGRYAEALDARSLVEPCEVAELLAADVTRHAPVCTRSVVVRDVDTQPAWFQRLLAAVGGNGDVDMLLSAEVASWTSSLDRAFCALGCKVERGTLDAQAIDGRDAAVPSRHPVPAASFLEVAGPHARLRAYADAIEQMAQACDAVVPRIAVVSPCASKLASELSERLTARNISSEARLRVSFADTRVGSQFTALCDLVRRMKAAEEGAAAKTEWWPAPELSDWLASPLSGAGTFFARTFDKTLRMNRSKTVEGVRSMLQSVQGQARSSRKKMDDDSPWKVVPCVAADVFQYIWSERPVSAFKAMFAVLEVLPPSALGSADGAVQLQLELSMARRAIEVLMDDAHALDVSQAVAVTVLDQLSASVACQDAPMPASEDAPVAPTAHVVFCSLSEAAVAAPGSFDGVLFADVDVDSYPLSHEEGPLATLQAMFDRVPLTLEPAARLRRDFARASAASSGSAVLARQTHDRQAKDRYPAAIWTELVSAQKAAGIEPKVSLVGEELIACDLDPAASREMDVRRIACQPPQLLTDAAVPYLVLKHRADDDPSSPLVPRLTSASQIEAYSKCPLCWFVSYRVKPQGIDAGFSNMEKGNFVHDVLERVHAELIDSGERRVTPENLPSALRLLERVFDETVAAHAVKRGSEWPLVALSPVEERQVAEILPQLKRVLRYEAEALAPFAPQYLEFAFNGLGVEYAGWPLGGRIDRVDVDAEGRAVVIDYKHRSGVEEFKLSDPTVPDDATGKAPADDPRWLPDHTQALIYAQAIRRALGLDARAALYFSTKGGKPALRGAASAELLEEEKGDGRIPGLKKGFPGEGGSMAFDQLLDRVEAGIAVRLSELEQGVVAAADLTALDNRQRAQMRCAYNHGQGFERRDA